MRKASELNDFDDDDYSDEEDFEMENDNQQYVQLFSPLTSPSTIINSIPSTITIMKTKTTTTITTTTTRFSEKQTETIESKTSNNKYMTISSSSSSRLAPIFPCLLFSFSSLYRHIHVNNFLF